jgi:hypothetical protein
MARKLRIAAITLVLLFLFWVPLAVFIYGFSALLGGLLLLTPLIALQVLVLKTLQRRPAPRAATTVSNAEELNHETHERNEKEKEKPLMNANY